MFVDSVGDGVVVVVVVDEVTGDVVDDADDDGVDDDGRGVAMLSTSSSLIADTAPSRMQEGQGGGRIWVVLR